MPLLQHVERLANNNKKSLLIIVLLILCCSLITFDRHQHDLIFLREVPFSQLPGWNDADTRKSLEAFRISCQVLTKKNSKKTVNRSMLNLTASDWQPVCRASLAVDETSMTQTRAFFQRWFQPIEFFNYHALPGLFTGYYVASLQGSLTKSSKYHVPIYGSPSDLVTIDLSLFGYQPTRSATVGRLVGRQVLPFPTREEIDRGAIAKTTPVLAWVDNVIDRLFLEIQGSGVVKLDNGDQLFLNYDSSNGAPYTAIGHVLIEQGAMTKANQSMQRIRAYLLAHPDQIEPVINQNKSFVFFKIQPQNMAYGAQNVALTAGYSLAVDPAWVPMGMPIWLDTTYPDCYTDDQKTLQRLMIAQDVGGAIRGAVRGDVFWGEGVEAAGIAGKMKNSGYYWLLIPRQR